MLSQSDITIADRLRAMIDRAEGEAQGRKQGRKPVKVFVVPSSEPATVRVAQSPPAPELPKEHLMYDALLSGATRLQREGRTAEAASTLLEAAVWDVAYGLLQGSQVVAGYLRPGSTLLATTGLGQDDINSIYPQRSSLRPGFDPITEHRLGQQRSGRPTAYEDRLADRVEAALAIAEYKEAYGSGDLDRVYTAETGVELALDVGVATRNFPPQEFRPVYRALCLALGQERERLEAELVSSDRPYVLQARPEAF